MVRTIIMLGFKLGVGATVLALVLIGLIKVDSLMVALLLIASGLFAIQQLIAPSLTPIVRFAIVGSLVAVAAACAVKVGFGMALLLGSAALSFAWTDVRGALARDRIRGGAAAAFAKAALVAFT